MDALIERRCGNCTETHRTGSACTPCLTAPGGDRPLFKPTWAALAAARRVELKSPKVEPAPEPDRYPDDNPKTRFGLAKPPIALIPGPALVVTAEAFGDGAKKYGPANWREKPVTTSTYTSAAMRHLLAWIDGEENAPDSGVHHLGHAIGCLAILIDAQAQGSLNDDRPTPGKTSVLLAEKTKPLPVNN